MPKELKRMWINQPSTLQECHTLHGTNVLAYEEYEGSMRVYFLSGNTISQSMLRNILSEGWLETPSVPTVAVNQADVVEVVVGLHRALSRMIEKHDPDTLDAEWLSHSNELIQKLTGKDVPSSRHMIAT